MEFKIKNTMSFTFATLENNRLGYKSNKIGTRTIWQKLQNSDAQKQEAQSWRDVLFAGRRLRKAREEVLPPQRADSRALSPSPGRRWRAHGQTDSGASVQTEDPGQQEHVVGGPTRPTSQLTTRIGACGIGGRGDKQWRGRGPSTCKSTSLGPCLTPHTQFHSASTSSLTGRAGTARP